MVDILVYRKKSRLYGLLCTLLLNGALLLIMFPINIRTPNPPYPEGGGGSGNGIELNLGFTDAGIGVPQDEAADVKPQPAVEEKADENIVTQDVEEAPVISEKPVKNKVIPKKEVKKPEVKPEKVKVKPQPVVNTKALYPAKNSQTKSDGDKNIPGDQGNPNGSLGAKAFGGQSGKGGSGGGTGGGAGTGHGPGVGSGVSYSLIGRAPQSLPAPEYKQQVEGTVVVSVTVDKDGRVTQAEAGVKGSTTLDDVLLEAAKRAALQARFDRKPDAPAFQKGTISYKFRLQ